jgi:hypothetical protein
VSLLQQQSGREGACGFVVHLLQMHARVLVHEHVSLGAVVHTA